MTRHDNELLDAIWALTKPRTIKHLIGERLVPVTLPSLLDQLEAAVSGTVVNDGGGSTPSPANARSVVDSDALYELAKISTEVSDWCRARKLKPTRHPLVDIEAWHAARDETQDNRDSYHIRWLDSWAAMIENKLRPRKRFEITSPCPTCRADTWTDAEGDVMHHPVLLDYDADSGPGMLNGATAKCRNVSCGATWVGEFQLRRMRWDLDEQEAS